MDGARPSVHLAWRDLFFSATRSFQSRAANRLLLECFRAIGFGMVAVSIAFNPLIVGAKRTRPGFIEFLAGSNLNQNARAHRKPQARDPAARYLAECVDCCADRADPSSENNPISVPGVIAFNRLPPSGRNRAAIIITAIIISTLANFTSGRVEQRSYIVYTNLGQD